MEKFFHSIFPLQYEVKESKKNLSNWKKTPEKIGNKLEIIHDLFAKYKFSIYNYGIERLKILVSAILRSKHFAQSK